MKFFIRKWCFSPGLISSLLALVFFSLFISLGFWQLDRAEYKRDLYKTFLDKQTAPAIELTQIIKNKESDYQSVLWRPVIVRGQFDESKQILLDNQVEKEQPGYFVYTPFHTENEDVWVLVNRGWVSGGNSRSEIPELNKKVESKVTIKGTLKETPKTGLLLKNASPEKMAEGIMRVQNIDVKQLEALMKIQLLPIIMRLDSDSEHGYIRNWRLPGSGDEVHMGYAFQWFAFAATLFFIYLGANLNKSE